MLSDIQKKVLDKVSEFPKRDNFDETKIGLMLGLIASRNDEDFIDLMARQIVLQGLFLDMQEKQKNIPNYPKGGM